MTNKNLNNKVDFSQVVKNVKGYLTKSADSVIQIGRELKLARDYKDSIVDVEEQGIATVRYNAMYNKLPFGNKVGEKFILIYEDGMIAKYVSSVPSAYNTLYDKLRGLKSEDFDAMIKGVTIEKATGKLVSKKTRNGAEVKSFTLNAFSTAKEIDVMKQALGLIDAKDTGTDNNDSGGETNNDNYSGNSNQSNDDSVGGVYTLYNISIKKSDVGSANINSILALQDSIKKLVSDYKLDDVVDYFFDETIQVSQQNIVDTKNTG